jgi:hypothetical protein
MKVAVVSRYQEDCSWIKHLDLDHVFIYNKGEKINTKFGPTVSIENLPNVGREAHTWAYHFLKHYDNLADNTFLLQGDPFEHSGDLYGRLVYDYMEPTSLTSQYRANWPSQEFKKKEKTIYPFGYTVRLGHISCYSGGQINDTRAWFKERWEFMFEGDAPKDFYYPYGAMWAIPRKNVLIRDKNFWSILEMLLRNFKTAKMSDTIIDPWAMEALWPAVFDSQYRTKF